MNKLDVIMTISNFISSDYFEGIPLANTTSEKLLTSDAFTTLIGTIAVALIGILSTIVTLKISHKNEKTKMLEEHKLELEKLNTEQSKDIITQFTNMLKEENEKLNAELINLKSDNQVLKKEISELRDENEKISKYNQELLLQNNELIILNRKLTEQNEKLLSLKDNN